MSGRDYPTDEELQQIREWPVDDPRGWFAFIRSVWWAPEWGWHEVTISAPEAASDVFRYDISTGGWSGNEDIITAMTDNFLWNVTWMQSKRGGHYWLEIPAGYDAS